MPFVPITYDYLLIPYPTKDYLDLSWREDHHQNLTHRIYLWLAKTLIRGSRIGINHIESRGVKVGAWVINDPHDLEGVSKLGITNIMTDSPKAFTHHLSNRSD